MRWWGLSVSLLLLAACDEPPPAATLKEVPDTFVGQWEGDVGDCGVGGALSLAVTPTDLRFPDSSIAVTGVAPNGEIAARVDGHFKSAEAEWDGSVRLELSDGGRTLNVVNGATMNPRVKCP